MNHKFRWTVLLDPVTAEVLGFLPIYFYSYDPNKYNGW